MNVKLCALSLLLASAAIPALAIGRLADITVIDRDSGATLPVYSHQGEFWVAGTPGARYAISVRSKLGQRLMAVTAVDGINVLSGQTAAWQQTGYVFTSYSQYQIAGWRKSDFEVAAFEFSSLGDSYASQTGRPANVGVIGVALFREKQQLPAVTRPAPHHHPEHSSREMGDASANANGNTNTNANAKSKAAPASPPSPSALGQGESRSSSDLEASSSSRSAPQTTARLGTAHGQRETSVVETTTFTRLSSQPDEVVRIRYDSRANLLALGVIRAPQQQPTPDAFPQSPTARAPSYVPDPPQRRY